MATLGFPIYISIILCLTVKIRGDFTIITAVSKLKDMVDKLKDSVDSINVRIDNLEKLSNTNNVDSTEKDNVMTETGDVEQTNKRVIKALISEKVFVRKSLSVYEGKFKDFQKQMTEQMNVINSKFEASHDTCEQICAENVANLNSWNKSQENYLNRLEYAINNATIDRETCFIELQQTIDQVATNASTKIESVEMNIYESLPTRTEKIWASIGICPIPFDIDRRLSVKYEMSSSSHLDIREGNTIRNQDYAIFNCSNVIEQKYEPSSRRFQCVRGQWMEADISHDWKLGNNGAFPECREAICDHPCENGGVCFQDGLCRCEHMTTGERCQTLLCHENCTKNGGECVKPGTCGNCPKSRHGENCELAIPVCDEISPFHGGRIILQNDMRREHAVAILRCDNGYSLYPTGMESIRCKTTWLGELEWTPEPPLCYKNLKVEVPINCQTSASSNVELTHEQSFTLSPKVGHEFYATKNYLTTSSLTITNNNGTFDPPLPQCVPGRCNVWSLRYSNSMRVYFPNNTRATGQVDSHTEYNLACMDKYEFEENDYRNQEYVVRRCEYGRFENVPPCIEKRCVLTNDQLELSQSRRSSLELVEHNSRVYVNCKSNRHELYSKALNNYLKPFSTQCKYGRFDRAVNSLNCVPKRCVLTNDQLELSQVSRSGHIAHNSQVDVNCKSNRYELYSNALNNYLKTFSTRCEYGQFDRAVNSLNCVPKRCVLTNDQLEISQVSRSRHIAHNSQVDVKCKADRHELYSNVLHDYVPFNIRCEYGHFHPEVNSVNCVPKTDFKYVVRIQVSDKWNAGTGDNIYVRINGHDEHTTTFRMNGVFGRNKLVDSEIRGIDVRPIQTVVVSKDKGMTDDLLSILHVSIFIAESDDYYVFTKDDQPVWLTANTPVELSISHHPERCIHTYGEVLYRAPTGNDRGAKLGSVSLRECKQRCATTRSLSCYGIYFMQNKNNQSVGHCYHNRNSPDSNFFRDNRKEETDRKYVSYKRICREP